MKRIAFSVITLVIVLGAPFIEAQDQKSGTSDNKPPRPYFPVVHQLSAWGSAHTTSEKAVMYVGFVNGLFVRRGTPEFLDFSGCLQGVPYEQAIAMIDKYYKDNPQRWNQPLAFELITALTVPDGPCPGKDPWK